MTVDFGSRTRPLLLALVLAGAACDGAIGNHGSGTITGSGGAGGNDGPTMVDPGKVTAPTTPFDAKTAFYATSKVKNLLTGMPVDRRRRRARSRRRAPPACRSWCRPG